MAVAEGSGRVAGEGDAGGIEGASNVIEGHLHRRDVGSVAFCGPGKDMTADATSWAVEDPCARVAGGCRRRN